jgi:hypothetical protein
MDYLGRTTGGPVRTARLSRPAQPAAPARPPQCPQHPRTGKLRSSIRSPGGWEHLNVQSLNRACSDFRTKVSERRDWLRLWGSKVWIDSSQVRGAGIRSEFGSSGSYGLYKPVEDARRDDGVMESSKMYPTHE